MFITGSPDFQVCIGTSSLKDKLQNYTHSPEIKMQ